MLGDTMVNDTDPEVCEHCGSGLLSENQIPVEETLPYEQWVHWNATGILPEGALEAPPQYYSRVIGWEVQGVYDGMLFYRCPDCGYAWHRWIDPYMRGKAQQYIDECNAKLEAK
jgi:hypothetical protein